MTGEIYSLPASTAAPSQPLIPAAPWYTSPSQVAGVIAGLSQIASILIRWFHLGITDEQLQGYSADALQLVTIAAGLWAMYSRQTSTLAPLTMTRKGAAKLTIRNPPLLDADPRKVPPTPTEPTP